MQSEYTKGDIIKGTGLTPREVQYLTEEGLVIPEIENPAGDARGKVRRFSHSNYEDFHAAKVLYSFGVRLWQVKAFLSYVRQEKTVQMYRSQKLYRTTELYIFFLQTKGEKFRFNYLMASEPHRMPILEGEDMNQYSSYIVINYGEVLRNAALG